VLFLKKKGNSKMETRKQRRTFDKNFKVSTVKMMLNSGKSIRSIAHDLDISENTLHNWKKQYLSDTKNSFPGKGNQMLSSEDEVRRLKEELHIVTQQRDILKKAVAFFSKEEYKKLLS